MPEVARVSLAVDIYSSKQRTLDTHRGILIIPTLNLLIKRESQPLPIIAVSANTPSHDGPTFMPTLCCKLVACHVVAAAAEYQDIIETMKFLYFCLLLNKLKLLLFLAAFTE